MPATRFLIVPLILLLAACGDLTHLRQEALSGTPTPRILDARDTRALAHAWSATNFGSSIKGYTIESNSTHSALPHITSLIDGYQIRTRLPRQANEIGIPILAGTGDPTDVSLRLTPHAHQLTLQPATLVAHQLSPNRIRLDLLDPRGGATFDGRPLANGSSLLFDYIQQQQSQRLLNVRGLLSPSDYASRRGFYLSTPYDPKKIPVIFIHGIVSSPLIFRDMLTQLQRHPDLWERYQFWVYYYPTGEPWLASAAAFRRDLTELITTLDPDQNDSQLHEMVVVAHSMGGLITRASISHNSEALYHAYFRRELHQLRLTSGQKKRLQELLLYKPIPWPKCVIFLATPHQGSRLAEGPLEWMARQVIRLPGRILGGTILTVELLAGGEPGILTSNAYPLLRNGEVSVSQLDQDSPALQGLKDMPMRDGVHLHSIIGDLGGPHLRIGTDAVVPYDSAHLPNTESELIVRSNHGICDTPDAIKEVARILRLHR